MKLHDINVLIYAFRKDSQYHALSRALLNEAITSPASFAITGHTLCGFLRIATDRRIFPKDPAPLPIALQFARTLQTHPRALFLGPGQRHWNLVEAICLRTGTIGPMVSDVYLAAIAIENGCELITFDRDYARFPALTWRHPLESHAQTNPGKL